LSFFKRNDALAQEIANRGYDFIWQHLRMKDIKCYWRKLLKSYVKLLNYEVKPEDELIYISPKKDEL